VTDTTPVSQFTAGRKEESGQGAKWKCRRRDDELKIKDGYQREVKIISLLSLKPLLCTIRTEETTISQHKKMT